jgi:hypothetical protein
MVIKYYEYVFVDLVTQHALYMCRIVLPSVACPALLYFLIKGKIFGRGRGKLLNTKCVF